VGNTSEKAFFLGKTRIEKVGSNAYEFQSPRVMAILNTFNIWDPSPYVGSTVEEPPNLRTNPFEEGEFHVGEIPKYYSKLIKGKGIRNKGH